MTFPGILNLWPPKTTLGGGGSTFLELNNSKLNPHVRAKFGRDPMVMSKKGVTDTHTHIRRDTDSEHFIMTPPHPCIS